MVIDRDINITNAIIVCNIINIENIWTINIIQIRININITGYANKFMNIYIRIMLH